MKILVFGQTGQVARELARAAPTARFLGRDDADLTDPAACAAIIDRTDCDVVINAAAYTAVDRAEAEPALAQIVNAEAPAAMARAAAARGVAFLHLSTDYVFDGSGTTARKPTEQTDPLNVYGRSKRDGEVGVIAAAGAHLVLRTSWVFSAHGANFVRTMLRLGAERPVLRVVADQIGGPTPAADIAAALLRAAPLLRQGAPTGIYHFAGVPPISWAGFAREIMSGAGLPAQVEEICTAQYPTPARRPLNSRLDCSALERDYAIAAPDWRAGLQAVLNELRGAT